jgi:hypothetical protein
MTSLLEYLRFCKRSSNKRITNKHAATLARVDIHRQDDGDGYVEAWDQHHDIVGIWYVFKMSMLKMFYKVFDI